MLGRGVSRNCLAATVGTPMRCGILFASMSSNICAMMTQWKRRIAFLGRHGKLQPARLMDILRFPSGGGSRDRPDICHAGLP